MRNLKTILGTLVITFLFTGCSKNEDEVEQLQPVKTEKIENLHAPATYDHQTREYTGDFVKFSFEQGKIVEDDNWDIAFRATEIIVNGGKEVGNVKGEIPRKGNAALLLYKDKTLSDIKEAPVDSEFKQDKVGELALPKGDGWYSYKGRGLIVPKAGRIIVIKTNNGHYAKMEIASYHKDGKVSLATSNYYTFNYVYNPNKGDKNLQ